jgi:glycine cleavage system protein P-like pyridoxal-binding family
VPKGELTRDFGLRPYHADRGDHARTEILVPDAAHGPANPATAAMVGYKVVEVKSDARGNVDIADLKTKISPRTAGMMLTNPNTVGLFGRTNGRSMCLGACRWRLDVWRRRQLQRHFGDCQARQSGV